MVGFHWNYGIVQQQTATGGSPTLPSPTAGISATNLGPTFGTGILVGPTFNNSAVAMIPVGAGVGAGEHVVRINTIFAGNGGTVSNADLTFSISGFGNANCQLASVTVLGGSVPADITPWMDDADLQTITGGGPAIDANISGGGGVSTTVDVLASNVAAVSGNIFYLSFQEDSLGAGGAGAYPNGSFQTGDVVTITLTVTNTNGQSAFATTTVTMA